MKSKFAKAAGFTVIEIIVAVGLFGIMVSAIALVSADTIKNIRQTRMSMTRDQVVNQLRTTITNNKAILKSLKMPANTAFYNCMCGQGTCSHMQKVNGQFLPFTLYDAGGNIQSPRFFDDSGAPCQPQNAHCSIRVTTTFFAQCRPDLSSVNQNPPLTCNGTPADFIAVMYRVDENPESIRRNTVHFKGLSGPTYIEVDNILKEAGACP